MAMKVFLTPMMGGAFDIAAPLYQILYLFLMWVAQGIWKIDRIVLGIYSITDSVTRFIVDSLELFLPVILNPMEGFLILSLLIAVSLYGVSKVMSGIFPSWQPVDIGKAAIYGFVAMVYLSSAAALIPSIDETRRITGQLMMNNTMQVFSSLSFSITSDVPNAELSASNPYDIDNDPEIGVIDIVGTYVGMRGTEDLFAEIPSGLVSGYIYKPSNLSDCCFQYATTEFSSLDDTERSEAIESAQYGIGTLVMGAFLTPHVAAASLVWFILTLAALVVAVSLPIGFIFVPFRSTSGLLNMYIQRYVSLFLETIMSGFFLGFAESLIVSMRYLPFVLLHTIQLLSFFIVVWRLLSALKLLNQSIGGLVSGMSTGSSMSISQGAALGTGMAMGAVLTTAGVATGQAWLAKHGAMSVFSGLSSAWGGGGGVTGKQVIRGAYYASLVRDRKGNRVPAKGDDGMDSSIPDRGDDFAPGGDVDDMDMMLDDMVDAANLPVKSRKQKPPSPTNHYGKRQNYNRGANVVQNHEAGKVVSQLQQSDPNFHTKYKALHHALSIKKKELGDKFSAEARKGKLYQEIGKGWNEPAFYAAVDNILNPRQTRSVASIMNHMKPSDEETGERPSLAAQLRTPTLGQYSSMFNSIHMQADEMGLLESGENPNVNHLAMGYALYTQKGEDASREYLSEHAKSATEEQLNSLIDSMDVIHEVVGDEPIVLPKSLAPSADMYTGKIEPASSPVPSPPAPQTISSSPGETTLPISPMQMGISNHATSGGPGKSYESYTEGES